MCVNKFEKLLSLYTLNKKNSLFWLNWSDVSPAVASNADISTTFKYLWRYIFHGDWSVRISAGHVNGKKQPLQQADEKLIMFSCLSLLTISEDN